MITPQIEQKAYPEVKVAQTVVETSAESGSLSDAVWRIGECGHAMADPGVLVSGKKSGTLRMRRKLWIDATTPVGRLTMRCFQCWKLKTRAPG